jgi:acyl-Coa thioesterase superfamily protein
MSESIFVGEGEHFAPTEHARGPWDPGALHGGAPAALIVWAFEHMQPGAELPFARLSFQFLRPVPLAPLKLERSISRRGRRVQALEAELSADGVPVCRASGLRIAPAPEDLPEISLSQAIDRADPPLTPPEEGQHVHFALDDAQRKSFAATAMEMRFLSGAPLLQQDDGQAPTRQLAGAANVWMRLRHPLLPDQPLSPLVRLAATADFGNGVAAVLPFDEYLFINADLTITLNRRPQGEWIGLNARTLLHPGGIGWAESVLHDEHGPVGRAEQALVIQRR